LPSLKQVRIEKRKRKIGKKGKGKGKKPVGASR